MSHFYFAGDTFLAVDCLNDAATYAACKKILELGKPLSPDEIRDPDFSLRDAMKR
ncbi:MAG: oxidoreductase C-terminal domain-containing protein [Paracoccus sp. (in: a-proteobacteria)]